MQCYAASNNYSTTLEAAKEERSHSRPDLFSHPAFSTHQRLRRRHL